MNKQELNKRIIDWNAKTFHQRNKVQYIEDYIRLRLLILYQNKQDSNFHAKYLECLEILSGCKPNGFESIFQTMWKVHTASVFKMAVAFAYAVDILESQAELLALQYLADEEDN